MTTGTKVFLAVFAAFIGVLVLYYGMVAPSSPPQPALSDSLIPTEPTATSAAPEGSNLVSTSFELVDPAAAPGDVPAVRPLGAGHTEVASEPLGRFPDAAPPAGHPEGAPGGSAALAATGTEGSQQEPIADPRTNQAPGTDVAAIPAAEDPLIEKPSNQTTTNTPEFKVEHIIRPQPKASAPPTVRANRPADVSGAPKTVEYIVKNGDTMVSIAADWFGDESKWSLIAKANPWVDPARMQIGQKLQLPPKDARPEPIRPTPESGATADKKSERSVYVVRSGDTLAKIAREVYGNVAKWKDIYDANRAVIGNDPAELSPGLKLTLPKAPSAARSR